MNTIQKIIIGALSVIALGVAGYIIADNLLDSKKRQMDTPEKIVADYQDLQAEAERLQYFVDPECNNKKDVNDRIREMEKKLSDLADRKKEWLDNVPKLPDINPESIETTETSGRPGSEVPELTSDVPPLPDISPESIEVPGSQVPELTSDVPPLPDINLDSEYIPEMPEINTGRPGNEVPELTSDVPPLPDISPESIETLGQPGSEVPELDSNVPPLPEINEANIISPDEYIFQMAESEQKIINILQALKALCQDDAKPVKKVISDKCSDACKRHKACAAYTEDVTPADINDAYNTCMEECLTWPKEMIKCINATEIKTPNDCVGFVQCQVPQFYEEKYSQ